MKMLRTLLAGLLALGLCTPVLAQDNQGSSRLSIAKGGSSVFPSRAYAKLLNLSQYTVIATQGYDVDGDGGDAVFKKIVGNFVDTRILTGTVTNNGTSGCTNNTYFGIPFSGGSGRGAYAQVTVAGNVVTSVTMGGQSTAGYAAGDVLTATVTGCSTSVTWTVSTITTPTGSFTDAAGNKWQIVFPAAGMDARAMGVKFDWDGSDGGATDNWTTLQNAFSFASYPTLTGTDLGGSFGGQVLLPKTTAMFCGGGATTIIVPLGVKVVGQGNYTTILKPCDTWSASVNVFTLCDPSTHLACFGTMMQDLQIFTQRDVGGTSNAATVYTNNGQHESGLRNVVIYPGACKIAVYLDQGFGGATYITLDNVEVKGGKGTAACGGVDNPSVKIAYGSTQVLIKNLVLGGLSATFNGPRKTGLAITGGFITIQGFHPEQIIDPILINIAGGLGSGQVRLFGVVGGVDCVGLVTLAATNTVGNFMLGPPNALNGCTRMVTNGQPAGSNLTGPVLIDTIFNP